MLPQPKPIEPHALTKEWQKRATAWPEVNQTNKCRTKKLIPVSSLRSKLSAVCFAFLLAPLLSVLTTKGGDPLLSSLEGVASILVSHPNTCHNICGLFHGTLHSTISPHISSHGSETSPQPE
jgi:hypothetical protein